MRVSWAPFTAALVLLLVGGVFALQGAGVLPSQVMHGRVEWLVIGSLMVLAGLALGYRALGRGDEV